MQVAVALEAAGVRCWIAPRDIPAGSEYKAAITRGIHAVGQPLVFIEVAHSVESEQVPREIRRGR